MNGQTILIAGFSGRALAESARRAGFVPLVVDAFGDTDTRLAAHQVAVLPRALERGFDAAALDAALAELVAAAPSEPVGIVLGAGFEADPDLVAGLASRHPLIGCAPATVRRAKDPAALAGLCAELGVSHPAIRLTPPTDGAGWLSKRQGGSGGTHVRRASRRPARRAGRYFQREIAGTAISALGIVAGKDCAFAFSRQWTAPSPRHPFRYGGAAGSLELEADLEARLIEIGVDLARALDLRGLVSLDFMVANDGTPHLIEVNPRPGATLDVFDDDRGTLFTAHVLAGRGEASLERQFAVWAPPAAKATACLYAGRDPVRIATIAWPAWAHDRPAAGRTIPARDPIATVSAVARSAAEAETLCRERLETLAAMLYQMKPGKEVLT